MELGLSSTLLAGDPRLVDHIVGEVKSQGIFDQFRKECIADVDTKPAYQNLRTRVEGSVNSFLDKQLWEPELNKNQLRETLRKHIHEAPYLDAGVERIVDQVVNPKVYSVFMPQIEDVVYKFLGIERPKIKEKASGCGLKDLLPKDLDPVSPESDKNSLKDVSLESVDAIDDLDVKQDEKFELSSNEQKLEDTERNKDMVSENGHVSSEEKALDETCIGFNKTVNNISLNTSGKSDDKIDEEEEDSPTFEPIDIMNLNESNVSNDSHLSGMSELTSHRSRSPDFSNDLSQDNFDCSNQDSQLSKVSSDSRLSIVTDFGFSNHAQTPLHDGIKEDATKDKCENKITKDNFRALREFEPYKNKSNKNIFDSKKCKDSTYDSKDSKSIKLNLPSKENSSDATDSSTKDKYDNKSYKDKHKDSENSKSKSTKEKVYSKDSKYKEKDNDKKKQSSHSSSKHDKHSKGKIKDKVNPAKEVIEKSKDNSDNVKDNTSKIKEEKMKESDKKESSTNKEAKDLKDLYKEKIRELREKKELTEKEKLNKDNVKSSKESRDKKESMKDKKSYKKEHRSSTSKSHDEKNRYESKISKVSDKISDTKDKRPDSKEKTKRDDRSSKDVKEKSNLAKTESSGKSEKSDTKKVSKTGKEEKIEIKKDTKTISDKSCKKDIKTQMQGKTSDRSEKSVDIKKDSKSDGQSKDKKRRDDKKSKTKDDHSSLRKNSNDRRSTDRDGSNGSNSKSSQSSTSSSSTTTSKSSSSSLTKENNHVSNSSSETSDSIGESQINRMKLHSQNESYDEMSKSNLELSNELYYIPNNSSEDTPQIESQSNENNLPLKKRPLFNEDDLSSSNEVKIKKPKFAKNIHEAKKLMKIRKQMEKQKQKDDKKVEKKVEQKPDVITHPKPASNVDDVETVPDEERVQIIEIPDEEYEEPYPDRQMSLTLEERSMILLEGELRGTDLLQKQSNLVSKLSDLELCIKQSLDEAICHTRLLQNSNRTQNNSKVSQTPVINETCKDNVASSSSKDVLKTKDNTAVLEIVGTTSAKLLDTQSTEQIKSIDIDFENNDKVMIENTTDINTNIKENVACIDRNDNTVEQQKSPARSSTEYNEFDEQSPGQANAQSSKSEFIPKVNDDHEDCKYFKLDNEESDKFSSFLHSLEMVEGNTLEDMIESLGGQVVSSSSSTSKPMAPPMPKRKHSGSPLTDILINNSNNNNDGHKTTTAVSNDNSLNNIKKRKIIPSKKPRLHANPCVSQSLLNGENFVMPLSPESDVSATSEKIPSSNIMKEEKSRHRSSQRYSSDDLYKPRPLFSSSSRRSRRSNQV